MMKKHQHTIMPDAVAQTFAHYPVAIRASLLHLRHLILTVAEPLGACEESLKWGEPSYRVKQGSTVRISAIAKRPEYYGLYFHCQTSLVPTFKTIYGDLFDYEVDRAIVFHHSTPLPEQPLLHCIELALTYHKVKHLPHLGA